MVVVGYNTPDGLNPMESTMNTKWQEQEVDFLARILDAKDEEGNSLLKDPTVRRIVQGVRAYSQGVLGQAVFPDGEPISTCANP